MKGFSKLVSNNSSLILLIIKFCNDFNYVLLKNGFGGLIEKSKNLGKYILI